MSILDLTNIDSELETLVQTTTDNGSFSTGELDPLELLPTETWLYQFNKVATTGDTGTTLPSSDHSKNKLFRRSDGSTVQKET